FRVIERCSFNPVQDGYVLPDLATNLLAAGEQNQVPVILGTTADEYAQILASNAGITDTDYGADIHFMFGAAAGDIVLGAYPSSAYASPYQAWVQVWT